MENLDYTVLAQLEHHEKDKPKVCQSDLLRIYALLFSARCVSPLLTEKASISRREGFEIFEKSLNMALALFSDKTKYFSFEVTARLMDAVKYMWKETQPHLFLQSMILIYERSGWSTLNDNNAVEFISTIVGMARDFMSKPKKKDLKNYDEQKLVQCVLDFGKKGLTFAMGLESKVKICIVILQFLDSVSIHSLSKETPKIAVREHALLVERASEFIRVFLKTFTVEINKKYK